jgi:hypothetical protein
MPDAIDKFIDTPLPEEQASPVVTDDALSRFIDEPLSEEIDGFIDEPLPEETQTLPSAPRQSFGFSIDIPSPIGTDLPEPAQRLLSATTAAATEFTKGLTLDVVALGDIFPEIEELNNRFTQNIPVNDDDPIVDKVSKAIQNDPNIIAKIPAKLLGNFLTIGKISREIVKLRGVPKTINDFIQRGAETGIVTGLLAEPGIERDNFLEVVGDKLQNAVETGFLFGSIGGVAGTFSKAINAWKTRKPRLIETLREDLRRVFLDEKKVPRTPRSEAAVDTVLDDAIESAGGVDNVKTSTLKKAIKRAQDIKAKEVGIEPARGIPSPIETVTDNLVLGVEREVARPRALKIAPLSTPNRGTRAEQRSIKGRVRDITGQIKSDIITVREDIALREIMKASASASRKAFSEGKKVGISTQKLHQQRIKEAAQLRDELNNRIKGSVRKIEKAVKSNIPGDYQRELGKLTQGLDLEKGVLKRRTAKTLARRKGTLEFVERQIAEGGTMNVPLDIIRKAESRPLNDFTVDELEELGRAMENIAHMGRNKNRFVKLHQQRRIDEVEKQLIQANATLEGGKNPQPGPPFPPNTSAKMITDAWAATKSLGRTFNFFDARMERELERLDNMEEIGPNWTTFYGAMNNARNTEVTGAVNQYNKLNEAVDRFGIDIEKSKRTDRFVSDRVGYMKESDILGIVDALGDAHKIETIKQGSQLTEEMIDDITKSVKPNEWEFLEWLRPNIWEADFAELNKVTENTYGYSLNPVGGYSHRLIDFTTKKGNYLDQVQDDLIDQVWNRGRLVTKPSAKAGVIKSRIPGAQAKTVLDIWETLSSYIDASEHFKAFSEVGRDLRQLMNRPEFKANIDDKLGPEFFPQLDKWVTRTIAGRTDPANSFADYIFKKGRELAVTQWLGYNVVSSTKAMVSIENSMGLLRNKHLQLTAMYDYLRDPEFWHNWVVKKAPQFAFRAGGERDLQAVFKQAQRAGLFKGNKLDTSAFKLYTITDRFATDTSFLSHYRDFLKENPLGSEEEATLFATRNVLRTQPAPDMKDLPNSFAGGELSKSVTALRNQVNNNKEFFRHDIFGKFKNGSIPLSEALKRFVWLSMTGVTIGTLTRGRLQRTPREWAIDLTVPFVGGVFLFGTSFFNILNNYPSEAPIMATLTSLGKKIGKDDPVAWVEAVMLSLGLVSGVPIKNPIKYAKGAADIAKGETDDPRRLLWSEYQLRLPKPERGGRR